MSLDVVAEEHARQGSATGPRAVVIGAGFGGLAAAIRLLAKGYRVTLVERQQEPGGRAQVFERDGFRHDAGPTVITAPALFEELFELMGVRMADRVRLVPLDPWYRFRFPDGSVFNYGGTVEDTLAEIRRFEPADADGYLRLLEHSRKLYEAGFEDLSDVPFHDVRAMLGQTGRLLRLRAHDTVWRMVCRYLRNPRLREAFSIQPLLVGGSPFQTTSIYGLIHFLERRDGIKFAMGGTGAIVRALVDLLAERGARLRLGRTVTRILVSDGRVTGVTLDNASTLEADIIVSNADPMHLFGTMLASGETRTSARLKQRFARLSMGLFVLYFGTRRTYPDVAHHTIWMGERFRGLLDDIYRRQVLADDFSLYLHRPTATDPSFAPPGCDSFYVLCPVPHLGAGIDWSREGPRLRERIVSALDGTILPGLRESITGDFYMTPEDFAERYLSFQGTGFSLAPHFTQSAWFRFHNRAEGPRGLYLVGAGTHPGAGMPGVLCSAKVLDRLIPCAKDLVDRSCSH
ncbi:MAG: phytoene desaturase [Rhizobiales bacterium]|nr:phytoene desaturase [Hyphomicrobiales bacterium]